MYSLALDAIVDEMCTRERQPFAEFCAARTRIHRPDPKVRFWKGKGSKTFLFGKVHLMGKLLAWAESSVHRILTIELYI